MLYSQRVCYLVVVCLLLVSGLRGQELFPITENGFSNKIPERYLQVLIDPDGRFNAETALRSTEFKTSTGVAPIRTGTSQIAWVKLRLSNNTEHENLLLEYQLPIMESIEFYNELDEGVYSPAMVTGVNATSKKKYRDPFFYFDLHMAPGTSKTILLRVESGQPLWFPMRVIPTEHLLSHGTNFRRLVHGVFVGIMLVMLVYNLLIYLSTRYKLYLSYVLFVFFESFTQFGILGLYQNHFPVFGEAQNALSFYVLIIGIGVTGIYFFEQFIGIRKNVPRIVPLLNFLYLNYALSALLLLFGFKTYCYVYVQCLAMLASLVALLSSAYLGFLKKNRNARIMFSAWFLFLMGNFFFMLQEFGVLPNNALTHNTIMVGAALQTILFSLALGDVINVLRREKEDSEILNLQMKQEYSMLQLKLKEMQLGALQQQMNPHFIFNALNSVKRHLLKQATYQAEELLDRFSKLMRTSLNHSRVESIRVKEEVEFLTNYLLVEKGRFPNRFTFEIEVSDTLLEDDEVLIPPLLIQPLCENAVKHAFPNTIKNGHLSVHFWVETDEEVYCRISDNGVGMGKEGMTAKKPMSNPSLGMNLVQQRLEVLERQGLLAHFEIESTGSGRGTQILLTLPNYACY